MKPARNSPLPSLRLVLASGGLGLLLAGCGGNGEPKTTKPTESTEVSGPKKQPLSPEEDLHSPRKLTWEELEIPLEAEEKFEPWMISSRLKKLVGRSVRIQGFMYGGGIAQLNNIREFPLVREKECPFGKGAPPYHVILVELEGKRRTSYKTEMITVEGILSVKPYIGPDGKTWSVYQLEGTSVE